MNFLVDTGLGWIALVFFAVLVAAAELAHRFGHKVDPSAELRERINTVEAALLGLLGLMLAFTFAMSSGRFDERRALVVKEGDAIGTTWLRAQILDEPARGELHNLLRRYTDNRIAYYDSELEEGALDRNMEEADRLKRTIWRTALAQAKTEPASLPRALLLESLNETFDLQEERWVALHNHVPDSVILLLLLVSLTALGIGGFNFGLARKRHLTATLLLAVLVTAIVFVILDLDRPRSGLITVSQEALLDARRSLE